MKPATKVRLVGTILVVGIGAQMPAIKKGVSVDMPVAGHAVETREADDRNALVVAITARRESICRQRTQRASGVGKTVFLLSAPPKATLRRGYVPPYGTKLTRI